MVVEINRSCSIIVLLSVISVRLESIVACAAAEIAVLVSTEFLNILLIALKRDAFSVNR